MPPPDDAGDGPKHDTDPAVADTLNSEGSGADGSRARSAASTSSMGRAPRMVRAGDTLGRYEVGDELGEGGMATVFRARDTQLRRDVAVKVLFPHLARRTETVRRFQREARTAAGLEHPNILRIYDVGGAEADDPPYIVMELVRGHSLLQELEQRGPMLAEVVACIGALVADALVVAHAAGIIHRDLKPANVLVAQGGKILLADFGVARLETEDSLHTKTGALLGTPAYMSPEQASGEVATAKSDLYSLGAMLYQLATGSLPYAGSPAKVLSLIASGALMPPLRRRAAVGPDLSRVIVELMATELDARPANAATVAESLRRIALGGGFGDPAEELAAYFGDPDAFARERMPGVVTAMITSARRAVADAKLPRAIALADRAAALAPEDPAVAALVQTVTEGGRASDRRRWALVAGAGLLSVGTVAAGGYVLFGVDDAGTPAAVILDGAHARVPLDAPSDDIPFDAMGADAGVVLAIALPDAAARVAPRRDAGVAAVAPPDAAFFTVDAEVIAVTPPLDAAPAPGTILVYNDTWCTVSLDDREAGRVEARGKPLVLAAAPGRHTITCAQVALRKAWTKPVTVAAGREVSVRGELAGGAVSVDIAGDRAVIGGVSHVRGATAQVAGGRHQVKVYRGTRVVAEGWISVTGPCRLHEDGTRVVCDPT